MANELIGKHVGVLDKGFVELLDMMPHPTSGVSGDLAIVNAGACSLLAHAERRECLETFSHDVAPPLRRAVSPSPD